MCSPQKVLQSITTDISGHKKAVEKRLRENDFKVEGGTGQGIEFVVEMIDPIKVNAQGERLNDGISHPNPLQARAIERWLENLGWVVVRITIDPILPSNCPYHYWSLRLTPNEKVLNDLVDDISFLETKKEELPKEFGHLEEKELLEVIYPIVYGALWTGFTWNDHNYRESAHSYIVEALEKAGLGRKDRQKAEALLHRMKEVLES